MKKIIFILICLIAIETKAQDEQGRIAVERFIKDFNAEKFDDIYDTFTPDFQQAVSRNQGIALFKQVFAGTGKLDKAIARPKQGSVFIYIINGERANLNLSFEVADEGKLSKLRIAPAMDAPPVSAPAPLKTDNPRQSQVDKAVDIQFNAFQRAYNLKGLAFAVLKDGEEHYYGYGETVKGNNILPTKDALFDIGSISKTFTAYILATLVNKQKMSLTDRLDKYFKGLAPDVAAITIVQLANHSSALPNMGTIPANGIAGRDPNEQYTERDLENELVKVQLSGKPGTKFNYSNLGYAVLGYIVEKAGGKSYEDLLKDYILQPNKMKNTFYKKPSNYKQYTSGYDQNGVAKDYLNLNAYGPAGTIKSTTSDLLKYAKLIMSDDPAALLVRKITFETQNIGIAAQQPGLGLSWILNESGKIPFYFHNGATIGYRSYISIDPVSKTALVILNNSTADVTNLGAMITRDLLAK